MYAMTYASTMTSGSRIAPRSRAMTSDDLPEPMIPPTIQLAAMSLPMMGSPRCETATGTPLK